MAYARIPLGVRPSNALDDGIWDYRDMALPSESTSQPSFQRPGNGRTSIPSEEAGGEEYENVACTGTRGPDRRSSLF